MTWIQDQVVGRPNRSQHSSEHTCDDFTRMKFASLCRVGSSA